MISDPQINFEKSFRKEVVRCSTHGSNTADFIGASTLFQWISIRGEEFPNFLRALHEMI